VKTATPLSADIYVEMGGLVVDCELVVPADTRSGIDHAIDVLGATVTESSAPRPLGRVSGDALMHVLEAISATTGKGYRQQAGDQYTAHCPAHEDGTASLSVTIGEKGLVVVNCQAGCAFEEVRDAAGLRNEDFRTGPATPAPVKQASVLVATYPYRDEDGNILGTATRYENADGTKTIPWKGDPGALIYGLESIRSARAEDRAVWIVEGEKCVDALTACGEVAVTLRGGAGAGSDPVKAGALAGVLAGMRVVVCRDGDDAGKTWEHGLLAALRGPARSLSVVQVEKMKWAGGFDIADWAAENPSSDPREYLWFDARPIRNEHEQGAIIETTWLWDQRYPLGMFTLLAGDAKQGKSTLVTWAAASVTRGTLPGKFAGTPRTVLWLAMEETKDTIRGRLLAAGADLAKVLIVNGDEMPPRGDKAAWGSILAQANDPVLVIADPLGEAMGKHNASDDREVRESLNDLLRSLRIEEDSRTFVGIKHFVKMNRQDAAQTDPLNHISGSKAGFIGKARMIHILWKDADGDVCLAVQESNVVDPSAVPTVIGRTVSAQATTREGRVIETARFEVTREDLNVRWETHLKDVAAANREEMAAGKPGNAEKKEVESKIRALIAGQGWALATDCTALITEIGQQSPGQHARWKENLGLEHTKTRGAVKNATVWFDPAVIDQATAKTALLVPPPVDDREAP
jgi:hypothetical protein